MVQDTILHQCQAIQEPTPKEIMMDHTQRNIPHPIQHPSTPTSSSLVVPYLEVGKAPSVPSSLSSSFLFHLCEG
jgi:hypothetical protein